MDRFSAVLWWVAAVVVMFHPNAIPTDKPIAFLIMFLATAEYQRADRRAKREKSAREERGA